MRKQDNLAGWFLPLIALYCVGHAQAQQKCPAPRALSAPPGANIFQPQQETELGDLMAEQMDSRFLVIEDAELSAYMARIANRLLAQLPPTGLRFQIFLIDAPIADAFSTPGGRIYVSRKMVAFLRNEDELAGLLGHEIGHIVTHEPSMNMTLLFQQVLGVRQVTSREDIAGKYNQLLDHAARGADAYRKLAREEEPNQYVADQVALYAAGSAGYAPRAVLDFFDRLAQTHGKMGGFFSDWFGLTTPEEKRLREMQKEFAALPSTCAAASTGAAPPEFQNWQTDVIAYSGLAHREILPGLQTKRPLDPPLRDDITYVRFSPDGQYALAQDESSIFVLTSNPFALRFRIDAPEAHSASFTPDSKDIVFSTPGFRVEDWNVKDQKRVSVHEMVIQDGCVQSLLSPDGKSLACLTERANSSGIIPILYLDLQILDVVTAQAVFTKKEFLAPTFENAFSLAIRRLLEPGESDLEPMAFSPDAQYLAAASQSTTLAVDLKTRSSIPLHGSLNDMLKGGFAFLTSDRVIALNKSNPAKSAVLSFPSGELVQSVILGVQKLDATSQGNYALLRPVADALVGVMDLKTNKGVLALRQSPAIDVRGQQYLAQGLTGEVALFDLATMKSGDKAELPVSPLGALRAGAVSPDFHWLALSGNTRGAVWDLFSMKRLYYTRGFRGAFFDGDTGLFVDFPKLQQTERTIVRADLSALKLDPVVSLDADSSAKQYGPYLLSRKPSRKDKSLFQGITLEVQDARNGKSLWTMNIPKEAPEIVSFLPNENRVILKWHSETDSAKEEMRKSEVLAKQFSAKKDHIGVFLLLVLEAGTGHSLGTVLVDTGKNSFRVEGAYAAGDWLLLADNENRTLVYSLATGELKGSVFGNRSILSPTTSLLGTENKTGQLQIYSLPTLEKRLQISLASPIAMDRFSPDGKRLFVLTNDQHFYLFDTTSLGQPGFPNTTAP